MKSAATTQGLGGGPQKGIAQSWCLSRRTIDREAASVELRHWVDELASTRASQAAERVLFADGRRGRHHGDRDRGGGGRAGTIASCPTRQGTGSSWRATPGGGAETSWCTRGLHFLPRQDETLYQYYRPSARTVEIGIAMWRSQMGYLMSPELCARIAELPTSSPSNTAYRARCTRGSPGSPATD